MSDRNDKTKVVITDDHKIIRDGIKALLKGESSFDVTGEASNGEELLELLKTEEANVVLLDINMPGKTGTELAGVLKAKYPDLKVLMLSMMDHDSYVSKAIENGANGYLLKNAGKEELVSAIKLVASGASYISPSICLKLLNTSRSSLLTENELNVEHESLSKREIEVLHLIADGYTNSEIAEKLFNSKRTIETHRQNLLEKTKCKNTASLIKYAVQNRII
ncbi:response regulator [Pontibacter harenae]|uniref:response regulator n=1 Tax=Pontibacter harenae TaxID=2894083 RepID=UPI001E505582|nr:response regulator transcription factor [Pontibacter harenae]MCC9167295.1 response regulator transcription factor [Pontibacter harenae]